MRNKQRGARRAPPILFIDARVGVDLSEEAAGNIMPPRFLAINPLPANATADDVVRSLERIAYEARHRGLRAVETFYSLPQGRAYTLIEALTADDVRDTYERAGLPSVEVVRGERIFTDVLFVPSGR